MYLAFRIQCSYELCKPKYVDLGWEACDHVVIRFKVSVDPFLTTCVWQYSHCYSTLRGFTPGSARRWQSGEP